MVVNNVSLECVAVAPKQYPTGGLPEVAFVGKSNVGKSSLINSLINRKKMARTSQQPGKTRTINFFNVEQKIMFVDLPGYGYARISKSESEKWGSMIETYLKKREELKAIVFLVDIRHPLGKNDSQMLEWLRFYGYDMIIVGTKADKLTRNELFKNVAALKKQIGLRENEILLTFSSETKQGKEELWEAIEKIVLEEKC